MKTLIKLILCSFLLINISACQKRVNACFEHFSPTYNTSIPVFFNAQCSVGAEGFHWDFGDGTTEDYYYSDTITHRYLNPGTYTVKLQINDEVHFFNDIAIEGSIFEIEKTVVIN